MIINPIIPIWLMVIICVAMLFLKRKGIVPYIRQIIIVILVFIINLRIMVPDSNAKGKTQQLDAYVLFVIDDTISMLARDYDGDTERLTAVKEDCSYIIDELYGAKFSVITYHNTANLKSPFTDNADYAKNVVNSTYPLHEFYAKGSSMNICKELMIETLKDAHDKGDGNVIVFFISDGEITNEDTLDSFEEAADYIDNGAVLGYGTEEGGEMYVQSYFDDKPEVVKDTSDYPFKNAKSKID
ncbi:MAG: VWA domain-containing protein, partial [Coprococcus sp.]